MLPGRGQVGLPRVDGGRGQLRPDHGRGQGSLLAQDRANAKNETNQPIFQMFGRFLVSGCRLH